MVTKALDRFFKKKSKIEDMHKSDENNNEKKENGKSAGNKKLFYIFF